MYILMIIINLQYQSITLSLMIIVQIITTAIGTDDGENQEKTFNLGDVIEFIEQCIILNQCKIIKKN